MDWIAGIFELAGLYVVGNRNRIGWLFGLVGNLLWTFLAFRLHIYGLLLVVVPAMFINIRNYRRWGR